MSETLPALFISHGSPMMAIEDRPAHHFLAGLGGAIARPKAILALSAHWGTTAPIVSAATTPSNPLLMRCASLYLVGTSCEVR